MSFNESESFEFESEKEATLRKAILDELDRLFPPKPPLPRFHYPAWILVFLLCFGILLGQGMTSLSPVMYTVHQLKAAKTALFYEQRTIAEAHLEKAEKQSPDSRVVRFEKALILDTPEAIHLIESTSIHPWHLIPMIGTSSHLLLNQLSVEKQKALRWAWPWSILPIPAPFQLINKETHL